MPLTAPEPPVEMPHRARAASGDASHRARAASGDASHRARVASGDASHRARAASGDASHRARAASGDASHRARAASGDTAPESPVEMPLTAPEPPVETPLTAPEPPVETPLTAPEPPVELHHVLWEPPLATTPMRLDPALTSPPMQEDGEGDLHGMSWFYETMSVLFNSGNSVSFTGLSADTTTDRTPVTKSCTDGLGFNPMVASSPIPRQQSPPATMVPNRSSSPLVPASAGTSSECLDDFDEPPPSGPSELASSVTADVESSGLEAADNAVGKVRRARNKEEQTKEFAAKHLLHPVPPECMAGRCKLRCIDGISRDERRQINVTVNMLPASSRREWYRRFVTEEDGPTEQGKKRRRVLQWHLPVNSKKIRVCKSFFLSTLGFKAGNDKPVLNSITTDLAAPEDKRGRQEAVNKADQEVIEQHIMSFNPTAPHYRYLHAPDRRYLPADLTTAVLYRHFKETHGEAACSETTYRRTMNRLNIGFTKLGTEECSECAAFALHECEDKGGICPACEKHDEHLKYRNEARIAYQRDGERMWKDGEIIVSADMMRIFLLPQLPHKECIFTSRLVVYNETFSPVGRRSWRAGDVPRPVSVLWHEGLAGRDAPDVASAFIRYLQTQRDAEQVTIWLDNCTAQNKNWVLITGLLQTVNNPAGGLQKITLKFLQKGHTSMSADAVHQVCNKGLKRKRVVADMDDFKDAIEPSSRLLEMRPEDFLEVKSGISGQKLKLLGDSDSRPYLASFKVIEVRRGTHLVYTKTRHNMDQWRAFDITKGSFRLQEQPKPKTQARGVNKAKLLKLKQKLLPLLPPHRRLFWEGIRASSARELNG